jgi:hypothetical protein
MYELIQFHFHRPSEERINGKGYEMVVHLVHKDGEGQLAVLALLLERGKPQPVIQTVWNNLPLEKSTPWRHRPCSIRWNCCRRARLLHLHGFADHAAMPGRRAVDGDEGAGAGFAGPDGAVQPSVSAERAAGAAGSGRIIKESN